MSTTEKISITLGRAELQQAKILASRLGLSLSTVITDAVREHVEAKTRKAAGLAVLATFTVADQPSDKKMNQLLELWTHPDANQEPLVVQTVKRRARQSKSRAR